MKLLNIALAAALINPIASVAATDEFAATRDAWEISKRLTTEHWLAITQSTRRFYVYWGYQSKTVVDYELGIIHVMATGDTYETAKMNLSGAVSAAMDSIESFALITNGQGDVSSDIGQEVADTPVIEEVFDNTPIASQRFYMTADHLRRRGEIYIPLISRYSDINRLDPTLVAALIQEESMFNRHALSPANAKGLMQLVPDQGGRDAAELIGLGNREPTDAELYDAETNISMGTAYLRYLLDYYSYVTNDAAREGLALAAYNWGLSRVDSQINPTRGMSENDVLHRLAVAPRETRNYVNRIRESKETNYVRL